MSSEEPESIEGENKSWFAVRVKSNRERLVEQSLSAKGFTSCYPTFTNESKSKRISQRPLFPGYIFSNFDPLTLAPIVTTPGVVGVVSTGRRPEPIPAHEIESIFTLMSSGMTVRPCTFIEVGHRVRVSRGPLAGVEGTVLREKGEHRLVVSISLLLRSVVAEIDRAWLELSEIEEPVRPQSHCASSAAA